MSLSEVRQDRPRAECAKRDHTPLAIRGRNGSRAERQILNKNTIKNEPIFAYVEEGSQNGYQE